MTTPTSNANQNRPDVTPQGIADRRAANAARPWYTKKRHIAWMAVVGLITLAAVTGDPESAPEAEPAAVDEPAAEPEQVEAEHVADDPEPEPEPAVEEQEHDEFTAAVMCEEFVKDQLRAPATAGFPLPTDYQIEHKGDGRYRMDSHVDSENGFGAQIRTQFTCKIQHAGGDRWELVDLTFAE
jgi:hypothetical protein